MNLTCYASKSVDASDVQKWCPALATTTAAATCVLLHPDGTLGFDDEVGRVLVAGLTGEGIMIRLTNMPEWTAVSSVGRLEAQLRLHAPVIVSTQPSAELRAELLRSDNERLAKRKRSMLARRGQVMGAPPDPTHFSDWVSADGQASATTLEWIVLNSHVVSLWSHSEWGIYTVLISALAEITTRWIEQACVTARIPLVWVPATADFPSW